MGQEEVCNCLKKCKIPVSRTQIANELKEDPNKISKIIRALLIHNEIKCIEISRIEAREMFGPKAPNRRIKLYYME